jgi:hypothetical protein
MKAAAAGELRLDTEAVPLTEIESAWQLTDTKNKRLVVIP